MTCIPVITRTEFTVDSASLAYQYTFDVPNSLSSVLVLTLEPDQTEFATKTLTDDYTIDTATKIVTFNDLDARGPVGTKIRIRRCTERPRGVDINAENAFSPSTANRDQEQDFAFQQELETELSDVLHKTDRGDKWDAEGLEGGNAAPGLLGDSWVTLNQLNAAVFDGDVVDLNEPLVVILTGDGVTLAFNLPGARQTTPEKWFVFKNGVHQNSDSSSGGSGVYSITVTPGQDDQIVFNTAPENGAVVLCTILQGTVVSLLGDDSVTTEMIQNDAVTLAKINIGAGDPLRFMIFDANGDPAGRVAVHGDVSDFDTGVRQNRLDQMAVPTANLNVNDVKITGLASGTATGQAVHAGQLPISPARIAHTAGAANPGFAEDTITTGFTVNSVAYTFRYRSTGGVERHATVHSTLDNQNTSRWHEVMVTDSSGVLKAVLVRIRRNGNTGFKIIFDQTAWQAITGLHSGPQGVSYVALGEA